MSTFNSMFGTATITGRFSSEDYRTANGAKTLGTSGNKVLDFFSIAGASRGKDITAVFRAAMAENENLAVRSLLWLRDVRGGAGERAQFRTLAKTIADTDPRLAERIARRIPEVGRFDDLLIFVGTEAEHVALELIAEALRAGNGLAAKWMPRQDRDGAKAIRKYMGLAPKEWRNLVVTLSNGVVEQKMSAGNWSEINFSHVPSAAASRLKKAFARNAPAEYQNYLDALTRGEAKINASAIFPHDVIHRGIDATAEAQWKALPNYLEGSTDTILPVVDVSGSMGSLVPGSAVSCKDVAVALGIYIAERNDTKFKDLIISFSGSPNFHRIKGSLSEKVRQVRNSGEDMSTNLMGVFDTLLRRARSEGWTAEDMPTKLLILSDMEFNSVDYYARHGVAATNFQAIDAAYARAGLPRPHLVFWNLNGRPNNQPVTMSQEKTTLVSGFSPSVLKTVTLGKIVTPMDTMLEVLLNDRYNY